jgi:hypothetical protein
VGRVFCQLQQQAGADKAPQEPAAAVAAFWSMVIIFAHKIFLWFCYM